MANLPAADGAVLKSDENGRVYFNDLAPLRGAG